MLTDAIQGPENTSGPEPDAASYSAEVIHNDHHELTSHILILLQLSTWLSRMGDTLTPGQVTESVTESLGRCVVLLVWS